MKAIILILNEILTVSQLDHLKNIINPKVSKNYDDLIVERNFNLN
ncbi:Uncharacterised protein [Chryseobacterium carnipullorum]|uniref:Uncharacterized protein n=1 Tax=Chryseobacterium carnipullorum TaxID=1124835 RepID=A0A376EU54_CHRCU|nr:Uncharacterised protein [Chryseobacterium carnipullorum]